MSISLIDLMKKGYDASKIATALLMSNLELKEENNKNLSYEIGQRPFSNPRKQQPNRRPQSREKGMARLYLNIGKNHKVAIRDIVGAVAGESKIKGSVIGSIDMYDKYTFVEVPEKLADQVITAMNSSRIKGKNVKMELANTKRSRR